jgi:drug/metabolite transporter (DMT)-like permease
MSAWLLFLLLISTCGSALQGVLMAHFVRKLKPLISSTIRSLSLVLTMSPLLFFVGDGGFSAFQETKFWQLMLLSGGVVTLSQLLFFQALRLIPIGVVNIFFRGFLIIFSVSFGILFFDEKTTGPIFLGIFFILIGMILAIDFRNFKPKKTTTTNYSLGILMIIFVAILVTFGIALLKELSLNYDPFLIGWLWESLIGVFTGIIFLGYFFRGKITTKIQWQDIRNIALSASPTLIVTGVRMYALQQGVGIGIVNSVGAAGIIMTSVLAFLFYGEKLNKWQWLGAFITTAGIVWLFQVI